MQDLKDNRPQPAVRDRGYRELQKKINRLERLVVEYVEPSALLPNSYNPNRQNERDFELLTKSITEDGFTQPIVAIRDHNVIVDGEHRWRVAQKLGYTKVPVVFVDMTPEQMRVATLRHNRARGSEDITLAIGVLKDLQELGAIDWAKDSLMMSEDEMNKLLNDLPPTEALSGETFTEAWVNTRTYSDEKPSATLQVSESGNHVAASQKTVEAYQQLETATAKVTTEEDKFKLRQEMDSRTFRIAVSFMGDESKLIKAILGTQPAQNLVELCKKYAAA
jgi:hypothetical protein